MKKIIALLALPLLFLAGAAMAQSNPPAPPPYAALGAQTSLSATSSSSRVALPASVNAFGAITIQNTSATVDAYVALGGSTITALSSGGACLAPTFTQCLIPAGQTITIWAAGNTYVAGITASSSATLLIYQGTGPVFAKGKGGGSGTVNSGTTPDVAYYATSGSAVSDGGSAVVTAGGLNVTTALGAGKTGVGLSAANTAGIYSNGTDKMDVGPSGVSVLSTSFGLSGDQSASGIFSTSGIRYKNVAGTLNDTTSSGTVAINYVNIFGGNTLTATSSTTLTNNFNTYFTAPVCSTNVTCTNNWALGADSAKLGAGTFTGSSGTANPVSITPTINQSGTASYTALLVQPTESATGSGTKLLASFGTNASPGLVTITNAGTINFPQTATYNVPTLASFSGATGIGVFGNTKLNLIANNVGIASFQSNINGMLLRSVGLIQWGSAEINGAGDTGLSRDSAGVVDVGTGAQGSTAGSMKMTNITASGANVIFSGIGSDATHTDNTACLDSSTGLMYKGSGTLGVCLGTSSERYKHDIEALNFKATDAILRLQPVSYRYNKGYGNGGERKDYWLTAERTEKVLPQCVPLDRGGKPMTVDPICVQTFMLAAMQEQAKQIKALQVANDNLRKRVNRR